MRDSDAMSEPTDPDLHRELPIRPHAVLDCAFPASEETFTGQMMLRLAAGAWEDTDDLVAEFVETAREFEEYFPDEEPVAPQDVPALFEQVIAEYQRVVTSTHYDAVAFAALEEILAGRGIVLSWGDGFTTSDAVHAAGELAQAYLNQGQQVRGYVYVHTQDLDRMVLTGRLYLGFGVLGPRDDDATAAIGDELTRILQAAQLPATWNGDPNSRVEVHPVLPEFRIGDA